MADFNPFDKLFEQESLPPEHKKEVMKTIDTLKLMADMVDLFSVKQAKTSTSLLGGMLGSRGSTLPGSEPPSPPAGEAPSDPPKDG
jgi:hypothetical protein